MPVVKSDQSIARRVVPLQRLQEEREPAYKELQKMFQIFFHDPHPPFSREHAWQPPTDVFEVENAYVIKMELAGVSRSDFQISFEKGVLTVQGLRREMCRHHKVILRVMEISYGAFKRAIYLPEPVDHDGIEATYEAGFLEIVLPKPASERRKINVEPGE